MAPHEQAILSNAKVLRTITNHIDGTKVTITKLAISSYAVTFIDTDANELIDIRYYDNVESANKYAKKCAGILQRLWDKIHHC